jgi:hypothetical protein
MPPGAQPVKREKLIAVLPFDTISLDCSFS